MTTTVRAASEASCTSGVKAWIGPTVVNEALGTVGFVVRKMKVCRASPTTWTLCATNQATFEPRSTAWRMASSALSRSAISVAGNGPGEHVHQRPGHLDADGADDDPLDPLLGLENRLRLDGEHLPEEGDHEVQGTDRSNEGLADEDPPIENLLDRLNGVGWHDEGPPVWCFGGPR